MVCEYPEKVVSIVTLMASRMTCQRKRLFVYWLEDRDVTDICYQEGFVNTWLAFWDVTSLRF
jgi:hypothetical protein